MVILIGLREICSNRDESRVLSRPSLQKLQSSATDGSGIIASTATTTEFASPLIFTKDGDAVAPYRQFLTSNGSRCSCQCTCYTRGICENLSIPTGSPTSSISQQPTANLIVPQKEICTCSCTCNIPSLCLNYTSFPFLPTSQPTSQPTSLPTSCPTGKPVVASIVRPTSQTI